MTQNISTDYHFQDFGFTNSSDCEQSYLLDNGSVLGNCTKDVTQNYPRQYPEYRVGVCLNTYGYIFIATLGFIGNPLSFVVSRQRMGTSSPHFYMTVLAFWDFSFIIFKTIYNYKTNLGIRMGDVTCKLFHFLFPYTSHCAVWTLVAMTFERFIAIWFPWKMTSQFAVTRAKITVIIISLTLFGLNMHVMWTYRAEYRNNSVRCRMNTDIRLIWDWVDHVLYSFGPFLGIIILNVMIIIGLRNKEKKLGSLRKGPRDTGHVKTQRQITVMLLSVAMAFAILTGPKCIFGLINKYWDRSEFTTKDKAVWFLVFIIFDSLEDLQHCINFYLYFLTGRNFRKELMELFPCKCATPVTRPQPSDYTVMTTLQTEL